MKIVDRIKDTLVEDPEKELSPRLKGAQSFLSKGLNESGSVSWGMIILSIVGIYALIELILSIIKLFG